MKAALLLLFLIAPAHADDWKTPDKVLFTTFLVASAVDAAQTIQMLDEGYIELNPLYGECPSDRTVIITKVIEAGLVYLFAEHFPRWRRPFLSVLTVGQVALVAHNHSIGVRISF